jgi:8-oxo-dGTP diphosphatase
MLISQGIIVREDYILMVKQFVERGDVVWNFPGGGIEECESPEQAMVREVHEETGYWTRIIEQLPACSGKYSFVAEIVSGDMYLYKTLSENDDILEVAWIHIDDMDKFDSYTLPIRELVIKRLGIII